MGSLKALIKKEENQFLLLQHVLFICRFSSAHLPGLCVRLLDRKWRKETVTSACTRSLAAMEHRDLIRHRNRPLLICKSVCKKPQKNQFYSITAEFNIFFLTYSVAEIQNVLSCVHSFKETNRSLIQMMRSFYSER